MLHSFSIPHVLNYAQHPNYFSHFPPPALTGATGTCSETFFQNPGQYALDDFLPSGLTDRLGLPSVFRLLPVTVPFIDLPYFSQASVVSTLSP